ncbi:MAG: ABC transporter permease, partial [Firmicutes bacterium]|nr:ABC transporter permease [Bacillota bacterium]
YIVRRILVTIPVLIGITFVVFAMVSFAPGDAIKLMLGSETANPENVERLRRELGLDKPWYMQYGDYMWKLLHGDMGRSIVYRRPVADQIRERFGNTLILSLSSALVAVIIAVPLGVLAAAKRRSIIDYGATTLAMVGVSIPSFYLGLLLIILFGLKLRWLPIRGMRSVADGLGPFLRHLILPSVTLGSGMAAILTRLTRASVLDALSQDFVRTARAKGVYERKVLYKHAFRNALLPVVTTFGLQFGSLLGGAVIIETIFSWPGLGMLAVNAVKQRDIPLIQGTVLVFAVSFVAVTLLIDLLYVLIDPRIRYE